MDPSDVAVNAKWLQAIGVDDGETCDANSRIELIERLGFVGEPWCADALREATKEERNPYVRKAIDAARTNIRGLDP